ncbi:hypothetical protein DFH06DRAFT_1244904 [Mycena polygramma]|nr:hypothetical protein DFH06DRAFT_1244904 [Mycena polygramma]
MPPLTRTESLHSWWSDSNLLGPTISIHAAAKPLMKLMYHRQVRSFVEKKSLIQLSGATMDLCCSYLAFKYIANDQELDSQRAAHESRCGSATRPARRLRVPDRFHASRKQNTTTRPSFDSFIQQAVLSHFITEHVFPTQIRFAAARSTSAVMHGRGSYSPNS